MIKYAVRLRKEKFTPVKIPKNIEVKPDDFVLVQTERGLEVAKIFKVCSKISKMFEAKGEVSYIPFIRVLNKDDFKNLDQIKREEEEAYKKCKELIEKFKLCMNLSFVSYTFDKKKLSFYYTAKDRVDFRGLLKELTQIFKKVRIDLRHVGVRDETSLMEGVGICGKEFCCSKFLRKFESTNIKLAKDQGLQISSTKVTGTCGRLLCCLNYEYSNYIDSARDLPPVGSAVMTSDGLGKVCSLNFLNYKITVKLEDGKIKDYTRKEIDVVDADVNVDININNNLNYIQEELDIDLNQLEDEK